MGSFELGSSVLGQVQVAGVVNTVTSICVA